MPSLTANGSTVSKAFVLALLPCTGAKMTSDHRSAPGLKSEIPPIDVCSFRPRVFPHMEKRKVDPALLCSQASRVVECRSYSQTQGAIDVRKVQAGGLTLVPFMA